MAGFDAEMSARVAEVLRTIFDTEETEAPEASDEAAPVEPASSEFDLDIPNYPPEATSPRR